MVLTALLVVRLAALWFRLRCDPGRVGFLSCERHYDRVSLFVSVSILLKKTPVNFLHYCTLVYHVHVLRPLLDPVMEIRNTMFHNNGNMRTDTRHSTYKITLYNMSFRDLRSLEDSMIMNFY